MSDFFEINDEDITALRGKVVILTGCSSGIGLATTSLILSLGSKVVGGDINPPPQPSASSTPTAKATATPITDNADFTFIQTNVTVWKDLVNLFKQTISQHGRVDHVFANAGVGRTTNYLDNMQVDAETGELLEPSFRTYEVNLRGVINTCALALHYMRKQLADPPANSDLQSGPGSGSGSGINYSITMTASASSFQRFEAVDYTTSKHGVLGFLRGMTPLLMPQSSSSPPTTTSNSSTATTTTTKTPIPIRINAISPSWTTTGLVPPAILERAMGKPPQDPSVVARSVALLMTDVRRHGQMIYSIDGRYREVEEGVFLKNVQREIFGGGVEGDGGQMDDNTVLRRMTRIMSEESGK